MKRSVILYWHNMFSYQVLQLNEDDFSVRAQYFFIVTSTITRGVGQQEKHQDTAE